MTDDELRDIARAAKASVPKPYLSETLEADQDINVWLDYHMATDRAALRAVAQGAWREGFQEGRNADHNSTWWPSNPYRRTSSDAGSDRG